ncbi:MAG: hypothetical protein JXR37_32885, partial [Kiritimatiellae bacterium]|nr:hypothetical protein [Kiritimatiellia bacterium]
DTILAGTFYGGSGFELLYGAAMDARTNIYIVGDTSSTNLPTTPNAFQTNDLPDTDGFLAVFDSSLSNLLLGTYLGGSKIDICFSVAVHPATRDILLGGITDSTNFPVTNNFLHMTLLQRTGFVSLIASNGHDLIFSTYLGGSSGSYVTAVGFYTNESIMAAGYTHSLDFPVTNAFQDTFGGPGSGTLDDDAFFTMFTTGRTGLAYSTYLGGTHDDTVIDMLYDDRGRIYLAGATCSTNFPVTANAHQPQKAQAPDTWYRDAYFAVFSQEPTGLVYATYFGGGAHDYSSCMNLDEYGAIYLVPYSESSGSPWTPTNALYPTRLGDDDAAVVKFVEPYIRFDGMALGAGGAEINWYTDGRRSAVVEYTDDPRNDWNQLGTYSNLELTGGSMTITDTAPAAATRCYRIRPER